MKRVVEIGQGRINMLALKQLALLLVTFGILVAAFYPTTSLLASSWNNQSGYSHGPLVLLVSIWLVFREIRNRPLSAPVTPSKWLFLFVIVACCAWVLAYLSATQAIHMIAFIGILYGAVSWIFGAESAARFLIPVGILMFAVPIWDVLTPSLQQLTITVNSQVLGSFGWTAFIVGDIVHLRSGTFRIAEGCSGTHFLVVALTLGVLYVHLNYQSFRYCVLFVLLTSITAMIANWVRIFVIIIIGDVTNMQHFLIKVDHYYFGWGVFALMLIPLFKFGGIIQEWDDKAARSMRPKSWPRKVIGAKNHERGRFANHWIGTVIFVLILMAPPIMASRTISASSVESDLELSLPDSIGPWRSAGEISYEEIPLPDFSGTQAVLIHSYQRGDDLVVIYLNRYIQQRQGAELVGYYNSWYPQDWTALLADKSMRNIVDAPGQLKVEQLQRASHMKLMLYGYIVGRRVLVSELAVKFNGAVRLLLGDSVSGAVAIVLDCDVNCDRARANAAEFLNDALPVLMLAIYGGNNGSQLRVVHD